MRRTVVTVALVLVVGCSGGGKGGKSGKPAPPAPPSSTSSTTTPQPVTIGKTINFEEFTISFVAADFRPAENLLKLTTQVTNTLSSPQEFNPTFSITSAGETYEGRAAKNPTIAPLGSLPVPVELDVSVDTRFTMNDAVITFGNSTKNQPVVPLGASGKFAPMLDVPAPVPATITAGEQTFAFSAAVVSAYEYDGSELDAGTRELQLTLSVHNNDGLHAYRIDGTDFGFMNGSETLNSAVVKMATANPGGLVDNVRVYADVDRYAGGAPLKITIVGADAQQGRVGQQVTMILPPLE